jgi:hypothetical protein
MLNINYISIAYVNKVLLLERKYVENLKVYVMEKRTRKMNSLY